MQERFNTFTVLIAKLGRIIRRIKTEEMQEFDLKSTHVSCLYHLHLHGALTSKQLSDECGEDKAAVSRSLEYLEKNGYIYTVKDATKRYKCPLELTDKGMEVALRISKKIDGYLSIANQGISEADRTVMYKTLLTISDNLESAYDGEA